MPRTRYIAVPIFLLCACATTAPQTYTSYDATLESIERQQRGAPRQPLTPSALNTFEDKYIKIAWRPEATQLAFTLTNKTDASIRVLWDDASFVDANGKTDRIMHQGVKYVDRSASMPPTLVVHGATLDDLLAPSSRVYWREGYGRYDVGEWQSGPLVPAGSAAAVADAHRSISVLLPLEANREVQEYLFTFAVQSHFVSSVAAQAKADAIKIVRKPEEIHHCQELGTVLAHPPYIWPGDDYRQLRSKAAPLGADTILVPGLRIGSVQGVAYRCGGK